MATQEKTWNVANRLHSLKDSDNPEVNHIIAGADEIYDDEKGAKQSNINAQTDSALADRYTKAETYSKEQLDALITTPDVNYVTVATFADLPKTGEANTVYRVSSYDGTQVDASKYALCAWDGTSYQLLAVRSAVGEVFDVSEYNSGATYETLTAALAAVPASVQRGGMSIKFILRTNTGTEEEPVYDNKYIQARCMAQNFTTDVTQWQGVDKELVAGSRNLAESGGVLIDSIEAKSLLPFSKMTQFNGWLFENGTVSERGYHKVVATSGASVLKIKRGADNFCIAIVKSYNGYQGGDTITDFATGETGVRKIAGTSEFNINIPSDANYIMIGEMAQPGLTIRTPSILMLDEYDVLKGVITDLNDEKKRNEKSVSNLSSIINANKSIINANKVSNKFGKNLWFPQEILINKYYTSTGQLGGGPSGKTDLRCIVNYIPLKPSTTYCFSNENGNVPARNGIYFCFYNSELELIDTVNGTSPTFTTPANCAYGRFSYQESLNSYIQLEEGSLRTFYEEPSPILGYEVSRIAKNSVQNDSLSDKSVTPEKTTLFTVGKNLFDYHTAIPGVYINGLGHEGSDPNGSSTDYIPIDHSKGNIVSNKFGSGGSSNAFYDSEKVFISGSAFKGATAQIPQNAAFVRFSLPKTSTEAALKTVQVEYGTESTSYEPYSYTIKDKYLPVTDNAKVDIILPDTIYAIVGDVLQIFHMSVIGATNPYFYNIVVSCDIGINYPRYYEVTPAASHIGNHTLTYMVKDNEGNVLASKEVTLVVKAALTNPSSEKNILTVSDSIYANGYIVEELNRRFSGSGGSPAGLGLTNVKFIGRKEVRGVYFEATGGYGWGTYASNAFKSLRFYVSGTTSLHLGDTYTIDDVPQSSTYYLTIIEINTGGVDPDNILCEVYGGYIYSSIPASGTLTKRSGTGDATISYSSYIEEPGNPFWNANSNSLDFQNYSTLYCDGKDIDYLITQLGGNGINTKERADTNIESYVKPFARQLHTDYPDAKLVIGGIIPQSNKGIKYASEIFNYYQLKSTYLYYLSKIQEMANSDEFSGYVLVADTMGEFDSENGYPVTAKPVNHRDSSQTEEITTNPQHPTEDGDKLMSDTWYKVLSNII